jgi:hypothetical protein
MQLDWATATAQRAAACAAEGVGREAAALSNAEVELSLREELAQEEQEQAAGFVGKGQQYDRELRKLQQQLKPVLDSPEVWVEGISGQTLPNMRQYCACRASEMLLLHGPHTRCSCLPALVPICKAGYHRQLSSSVNCPPQKTKAAVSVECWCQGLTAQLGK